MAVFVSCRLIDDAGSRALTTDKLVTCHQAGWHGLVQSMDVRFVNTGPQFARAVAGVKLSKVTMFVVE